SGRGSNFEAIAAAVQSGKLQAEIAVVIGNIESAAGLTRARGMGLETICIPSRGKTREAFDAELIAALRSHDVGLVVLAGFMRVLSSAFIAAFPNRIVNIHPALLPSFPGLHVQQQALD